MLYFRCWHLGWGAGYGGGHLSKGQLTTPPAPNKQRVRALIDRGRVHEETVQSALTVIFKLVDSVQSLSCVQLYDPMDCSMPGFPVHHQLPEPTQTHAHHISDAIQPSHPLLSPSPLTFPGSGRRETNSRTRKSPSFQDAARLSPAILGSPTEAWLLFSGDQPDGRALPPWVFPRRPHISTALAIRAGRATGAGRNTALSLDPTPPNWIPPKTQPSQRAGEGRMYYSSLQQVRRTQDLSSNRKTGEILS